MRICTLHLPPTTRRRKALPLAVADRFSWGTLIFGWIALLRPTAWIAGLLLGAATLVLHRVLGDTRGWWPVLAALHVAPAAFLPEIRRWQLGLAGWQRIATTVASSETAARDRAVAAAAAPLPFAA